MWLIEAVDARICGTVWLWTPRYVVQCGCGRQDMWYCVAVDAKIIRRFPTSMVYLKHDIW